jgi:Haem degrading protein HbpS-like
VAQIISNAVATANQTRAQIRLPIGERAKMVIAVSDLDGTLIGLHRMTDSTIFSIDVAATKARNVIYFSGATRQAADLNEVPMGAAVTNRTIGFGAQPFFPSGIDVTRAVFQSLYDGCRASVYSGASGSRLGLADGEPERHRIFPGLRTAL